MDTPATRGAGSYHVPGLFRVFIFSSLTSTSNSYKSISMFLFNDNTVSLLAFSQMVSLVAVVIINATWWLRPYLKNRLCPITELNQSMYN